MTITLNHTIVPAHDKRASAQFFARIFGLHAADPKGSHFAPLRINYTLTLLFDDDEGFESHHYAFHVTWPACAGLQIFWRPSRTR